MYIKKTVRVLLNTICLPTGPDLCLYQILSKYFKPHIQDFGLGIHSREITTKQPQQRLSFLHITWLLVIIYASTKYYQNSHWVHRNQA